jgi:hypothetical protein
MLTFKFKDNDNDVSVSTLLHSDIYEVVEEFIRFLKAVSYTDIVIRKGLESGIDFINQDIEYNYDFDKDGVDV